MFVLAANKPERSNVNKCKYACIAKSKKRPVAAQKKRIILSTTTKGLMQWYLSTHLDSSSRLDPNLSYWRAPLSPRGSGTERAIRRERDEEGDGHLSCRVASHWAGPRQGASLRCALCWWGSVRAKDRTAVVCRGPDACPRRRALGYTLRNNN